MFKLYSNKIAWWLTRTCVAVAAVFFCATADVDAAAYYVERFDVDDAGWAGRDGEMYVTHDPLFGSMPGSLSGTFALQGSPSPEIDAFRITSGASGGAFTGNYLTDVPDYEYWSFSFYADDVLPSFLMLSFDANGTVFNRLLTPQVTAIDRWYIVRAPITFDGLWFGGSQAAFDAGLANVGYIDIQISRNGSSEQSVFVDNFGLYEKGQSDVAVPEPTTLTLLGLAASAFVIWSRRRIRRFDVEGRE